MAKGDYVLIENHEWNQTKLDAKYGGPFMIAEVLDGDRYLLKGLNSNRTYKYARDRISSLLKPYIPDELDLCLSGSDEEVGELTYLLLMICFLLGLISAKCKNLCGCTI